MTKKANLNEIKYVIYARKSTSGLKRQSKSIEDQVDSMREIAEKNGYKVVKVFTERQSAKRPGRRPVFDAMIKYIEDGRANAILCWRANRLARNSLEGGKIVNMLETEVIKVVRTHGSIYHSYDNILPLMIEFGMASQYSRDMIDDIKRGMQTNCEQGLFNHKAPQGYRNSRDVFNNNKPMVIKDISTINGVEENRFELIKKMFGAYLTGNYTVPEVYRMLEEWGYTNPDTGKMIGLGTLHHILEDMFYAGHIRNYKTGELIRGQWEPMITMAEYDRIQEIKGRYVREHGKKPRVSIHSRRFELRGVMRCATCQCSIIPEMQRKRLANGGYTEHVYYRCTHKSKNRPCSLWGGIKQEEAYAQIDALLDKYTIGSELYEWGIEILRDIYEEEIAQRHNVKNMQYSSVDKLKQRLKKYADMHADGLITEEEFAEMSSDTRSMIDEIEESKREVEEHAKGWYEIIGKTLEILVDPKEKFDAATCAGEKRSILQAIGPDPVLNNGKVIGKNRSGKVLTEKVIEVEPYPWLIPLQKTAQKIGEVHPKVLTNSDPCDNASKKASYQKWCWK